MPSSIFRSLLASVALTAAVVSSAQAQQHLFVDVPGAQFSATRSEHSKHIVSQRLVRINPAALADGLVPHGSSSVSPEVRKGWARQLIGSVKLNLAPGVDPTFNRTAVEASAEGGLDWNGTLGDNPEAGTAVLLAREGKVLGQVQVGDRTFQITPQSGDLHMITEISTAGMPDDIVVPTPKVPAAAHDPVPAATTTGPVWIDVMFVFTKRARDGAVAQGKTIGQEMALAVSLANAAYRTTGTRVRLRRVKPVYAGNSYDELTRSSYGQLLDDIRSGSMFANMRSLRDSRGADLVAMLHERTEYCGIAYVVENPSAGTAGWGYSATTRGCISNHSFAHEVGHNIGLRHDRYVDSSAGLGYNFGYVNTTARIRSIMAYANKCSDQGISCARVNMFSTFVRLYNGTSTIGERTGAERAFNVRTLNVNGPAIAAYRNLPVADPAALAMGDAR